MYHYFMISTKFSSITVLLIVCVLLKMESKQQSARNKILHNCLQNPTFSFSEIARLSNEHRNTVRRVIIRYKETLSVDRKPGSGGRTHSTDAETVKKVLTAIKRNPNASERDLAKKFGIGQTTVNKIKQDHGIKSFKVQKVPDRAPEKLLVIKKRSRKLYDEYLTKTDSCLILDDETYVKANYQQLPGQEYYCATERGKVAEQFKTRKVTKYPKKFLVWQAICTCGKRSKAFITTGTINSEIYIKECLQKRLLPFLRSHSGSPCFWPDLASCHYSAAALEWYHTNNINIVPKEANPPNCPEFRPIEKYWALIKRELKKTKATALTVENFRNRCYKAADKVGESVVRTLMATVNNRVRTFLRENEL